VGGGDMGGIFGMLEGLVNTGNKIGKFAVKQAIAHQSGAKTKLTIPKTKTDMFHMDLSHIKIPYKEYIADLKTDQGLPKDYIQGLVKQARSIEHLKAIKSYLTSKRNTLDYHTTQSILKSLTNKAKEIEYHKQMKDTFQNMPDPLALIHEHIQHLGWWC
jgi:hypothetical protein